MNVYVKKKEKRIANLVFFIVLHIHYIYMNTDIVI